MEGALNAWTQAAAPPSQDPEGSLYGGAVCPASTMDTPPWDSHSRGKADDVKSRIQNSHFRCGRSRIGLSVGRDYPGQGHSCSVSMAPATWPKGDGQEGRVQRPPEIKTEGKLGLGTDPRSRDDHTLPTEKPSLTKGPRPPQAALSSGTPCDPEAPSCPALWEDLQSEFPQSSLMPGICPADAPAINSG